MAGDSFTDVIIVDVTSVGIQGPPGPVGPIGPAGPTGTTGLTPITAAGSTTPRALQDRFAESVNVKDFGAAGDGVTDDAPAINAAIAYVRTLLAAQSSTVRGAFRLVFPSAIYCVKSTLNFTGLLPFTGGVIDGQGSVIYGQIAGAPVIDALGCRWLRFMHFNVFGDQTLTPSIGIQVGRLSSVSADYHTFTNVQVNGWFSFTAYYNFASEQMGHFACEFRNNAATANKFCMVLDGLNHWNAHSAFVTVTAAVETPQSFLNAHFVNCTWQASGGPAAIWLGNATNTKFDRGYLSNTAGSGVIVYQRASSGPAAGFLHFDVHMETAGLQHSFLFTGASGQTFAYITGFTYMDNTTQAAASVFAIDPGSSLTAISLRACALDIGGAAVPLFDNPAAWSVQARYAYLAHGMFNSTAATWSGKVEDINYTGFAIIPQTVTRVATTAGSYTIPWGTEWLKLTPAATIASFTLTMPTGPGGAAVYDATPLEITTTQTINNLVLVGSAGQTIGAQPGTMLSGTTLRYRFDGASSTWLPLGLLGIVSGSRGIVSSTVATVTANTVAVPLGTNYVVVNDAVNAVNTLTVGSGTLADGYDLWMTFPNGGTFSGLPMSAHGNLTLKTLGGGWSILSKYG